MSDDIDPNLDSIQSGIVQELRQAEQIDTAGLRMWLFVRKDLPMSFGKAGAQSGHAIGTCIWITTERDPHLMRTYMSEAQPKISVGVKNEGELLKCVEACREAGLVSVAVKDAAHTEFDNPTFTLGAVGPCLRSQLPKSVARLQLFRSFLSVAEA